MGLFKKRKVEANFSPKDLFGLCIYQEQNRTVYSFPFSKNGYVIGYDNLLRYNKYSLRGLLSLLAGGIFFMFVGDYFKSFMAGLSLYVFLTVLFRARFLESCPVIHNYKKPKRDLIKEIGKNYSYAKLIFTMTLINICAFSIAASSFVLGQGIGNVIFSICTIIFLVAAFIFEAIILITKRKNEII